MMLRIIAVLAIALTPALACARDLGQWENSDPVIKQWYRSLMMPDLPTSSCCGESDAYWCDELHVTNGRVSCAITDDRDDMPLKRPHVPIGTMIEIPPNKLKWEQDGKPIGNPTGHAIVFMGSGKAVFCFVQATGI